jgi:hypothetical protein
MDHCPHSESPIMQELGTSLEEGAEDKQALPLIPLH